MVARGTAGITTVPGDVPGFTSAGGSSLPGGLDGEKPGGTDWRNLQAELKRCGRVPYMEFVRPHGEG